MTVASADGLLAPMIGPLGTPLRLKRYPLRFSTARVGAKYLNVVL